jgi:hypothetical protein
MKHLYFSVYFSRIASTNLNLFVTLLLDIHIYVCVCDIIFAQVHRAFYLSAGKLASVKIFLDINSLLVQSNSLLFAMQVARTFDKCDRNISGI